MASSMDDKALIAALKALMGLDPKATNEEVLTAYNKVATGEPADPAKPEEPKADPASPMGQTAAAARLGRLIRSSLVKAGETITDDALGARAIATLTDTVPRSELLAAQQKAQSMELQAAFDEAGRQGKVSADEIRSLKATFGHDPAALKAHLASLPPNRSVPVDQVVKPLPGDTQPGTADPAAALAEVYAAKAGIDKAKVMKALASIER